MRHRVMKLAQGATEYLVLLAVVLIIALVGIALLGFFPGTASDAQAAESQLYWKSASPVAVVDTIAYASDRIYLRFRNTGNYPLTITGILGDGSRVSHYYAYSGANLRDMSFYLYPGEETCTGSYYLPNNACLEHGVYIYLKSGGPRNQSTGYCTEQARCAT